MTPAPPALPRLLLDADPGYDDVVALVVATAFAEVLSVTTVAGNAPVERTTATAGAAAALCGWPGPVVAGAAHPLAGPYPTEQAAPNAPGLDAFHALGGPADGRGADPGAGPERQPPGCAAADVLAGAPAGSWIVATGPLTNLATAFAARPDLAARLAGVAVMGGALATGNVTPVAEFNVWSDPEAADRVVNAGVALRICPLEVTLDVLVDPGLVAATRALGSPAAALVADLLTAYATTYPDAGPRPGQAPLHDPCAVLAVTHPHLFAWDRLPVAVELAGGHTRGMTVFDRRFGRPAVDPVAEVAVAVDAEGVRAAVLEAVAALPPVPRPRAAR